MSRPRWELSASNTDDGVLVEVYEEGDSLPTFRTILQGHEVKRTLSRITIPELPADVGKTTFQDQTLKPGRWTLEIDGVELDIMPRALIINRQQEIPPL